MKVVVRKARKLEGARAGKLDAQTHRSIEAENLEAESLNNRPAFRGGSLRKIALTRPRIRKY